MSGFSSPAVMVGHSPGWTGGAPLSLWPWASLELWHKPQVQEGTCGSFLVAVVPPLGVLCGEAVLSTSGLGGSSLVFAGLLHSSCDRLISSYFRGLLSICGTVAPLWAQCAAGSSILLAGKSSPVLARSSSVCCWGLFPCEGIGLLLSCGGGLRVPLEV